MHFGTNQASSQGGQRRRGFMGLQEKKSNSVITLVSSSNVQIASADSMRSQMLPTNAFSSIMQI